MPEEARAIVPDYPRGRRSFYRIDVAFALFALLMEVIVCVALSLTDSQFVIKDWIFVNLILPTVLNALILSLAFAVRKRIPEEAIVPQNVLPVMTLVLMNIVTAIIHCRRPVLMVVFAIPICMTSLFAENKSCKIVTAMGVIGSLLASVRRVLTVEVVLHEVVLDELFALVTLLLTCLAAHAILNMTAVQKGKLMNFVVTTKATQAELEAARAQAEAANVAKSAFLANMSHEIRTPINAILGMNEMILRESRDSQITEYAQSVHSASTSLLYLVNDVLDFSKIESGKLELVEAPYDVASFLHDCHSMVVERAEKKGLQLTVECDHNLPTVLKGDEVRVRQVVTNLLSNAAKYTERGSIFFSAGCKRENGQFSLVVSVKDTGIGIREEDMGSLFSQFTRFSLQHNRNIEGTGLGLSITKQLVELMHGTIEVNSIFGVGSCFTVTIPQEVVNETPMGDFHKRYQDLNRRNEAYQKSFEAPDARILVVDDVEVNLKVIVNLLKETHMRVDTALSGLQCLEMTDKTKYDIIFLDHMMPELSGLETFQRLKAKENSINRDTPVVMLTANAISGVKEQYLKEGFAGYLSKPVNGSSLEHTVLELLSPEKVRRGDEEGTQPAEKAAPPAPAPAPAPEPPQPPADPETENRKLLRALKRAYPGIDLSNGIDLCAGSVEIYLDVLQSYGRSGKLDDIVGCYDRRDVKNYQILVHGVKSASKSMGMNSLSDQALALENAAREEDWATIQKLHPAFVEEYRAALEAVRQTIPGAAG